MLTSVANDVSEWCVLSPFGLANAQSSLAVDSNALIQRRRDVSKTRVANLGCRDPDSESYMANQKSVTIS